jgi:hypothetical protein
MRSRFAGDIVNSNRVGASETLDESESASESALFDAASLLPEIYTAWPDEFTVRE